MLVVSPTLFAHALWIETKAIGTKGKLQTIDVYFGEFSEKDIEKTAKWFSDIKDFSLILITPSKKEIKLTATALENKYQAFFMIKLVIVAPVVFALYDGNQEKLY